MLFYFFSYIQYRYNEYNIVIIMILLLLHNDTVFHIFTNILILIDIVDAFVGRSVSIKVSQLHIILLDIRICIQIIKHIFN